MRVLHVVPTYLPALRYGGPVRSIHGLCRALARRGHDVHVFTTNVDGPGELDVPLGIPVDVEGVKVWYFPTVLRRIYRSPAMKKALAAHVAEFDFVHLHSIFLWPTWAAARMAARKNIPYAVAPRGMLVKELIRRKSRLAKTAWIFLIEKITLRNAAFVHYTTQREESEARRVGILLPPGVVIPNGLDVEDTVGADDADSGERSAEAEAPLLYLGRVSWEKGLDRLIPALTSVPGVTLLIAGNDENAYRDTLQALAERCGVRDRIQFLGAVGELEKRELLRAASMLVLPSYSENFGNVVLEAMALGCPVVVTEEVGLADAVRESGAGIVVHGEPQLLGAAIAKLLQDRGEREAMGLRGRQTVRERFSWVAIARQMEDAYLSAIARSEPRQAPRVAE